MVISYSSWQDGEWKNTLSKLIEKTFLHFQAIVIDDSTYPYNAIASLEHDLILIGFCIRRLIEKRLVTDKLIKETINIRAYEKKSESTRKPFVSMMGGHVYESYNTSKELNMNLNYRQIGDELIHSTQIMTVYNDEVLPNGLLIASDWGQDKRLLHFTLEDLSMLVNNVLKDQVLIASDQWDPITGKVTVKRLHGINNKKADKDRNEQG